MIEELLVTGYKCLMMNAPMALKPLNVLVGANASGKSTLLQMLLLLRQSSDNSGQVDELHLSGELYEAGTANDILHPAAQHALNISLREAGAGYACNLSFRSDRETPNKRRLVRTGQDHPLPSVVFSRDAEFCYLNAERVGPRVTYALPPDDMEISGPVGKYGEYTAGRLARSKEDVTTIEGWCDEMIRKLAAGPELLDGIRISQLLVESGGRLDLVANLLLGWVIPGAEFSASEDAGIDSAPLRFIRDPSSTKVLTRATHVGFGLTYLLPILVAGLSLKADGIMLVENPEAHLHPFGQSRMGAFLATLASTGRQILVETHSDHVVNGIRLAIKRNLLPSGDVMFDYFKSSADHSTSEIVQISAESDGGLNSWPSGFFDQIELDLARL